MRRPFAWRTIAWTFWTIGVILVAMQVPVALLRAGRLRRTARPWAAYAGLPHRAVVRLHDEIGTPGTFGVVRPVILFPAQAERWDDREVQQALVHELEHVRRRDWAVHLAARIACAIYWFHPLVWLAWSRLRIESEHACDDAVVRSGDPVTYAQQLVALAERMSPGAQVPLLSMAGGSELSARITAVLDGTLRRGAAGWPTAMLAAAATIGVVAIVSPLHAAAAPDGDATPGAIVDPHRADMGADVKVGGATISGYLYDPFGNPVEGIDVGVEGLQFDTWTRGPDGPFARNAITGADGHFEFRYLRPGLYGLTAPTANGIVPVQVTVQAGEHAERDLYLRVEPLDDAFTVCRDCGSRADTYQLPDSIAKEFARDERDAAKQPVIPPEPIDSDDAPRPMPEYPESLKHSDLEGAVVVEGKIGVDGLRTAMRVVSSPHRELSEAAMAMLAAEQWRPAYVRGTPVEVPFRVTIDFVLDVKHTN